MKTKLVTAYYAFHHGPPFWGHQWRENWYKYSLVSLCNLGCEIICYTDEGDKGFNYISEAKEKYNLTNLTIKIFRLQENPWQDRVYEIRTNNPELYNNPSDPKFRLSPQIYWLKWLLMEKEIEPDINLYWIDCGLSHCGLFPKITNPYADDPRYDNNFEGEEPSAVIHRYQSFTRAFSPQAIERINNYHDGKIINICSSSRWNPVETFFQKTNLPEPTFDNNEAYRYPVAGFWGGNSNVIQDHIKKFYSVVEKVLLLGDYICTEQEIMFYLNGSEKHLFKNWKFDTFYHEDWISRGAFFPERNLICFYHFFTKELV